MFVETPYRNNISYNAFSETTNINGKHWPQTITPYAPSINATTGRIGTSSYDAAGNTTAERISSIPTVINRTMTYDAAGRTVYIYDPLVHTCCENNHTYDISYDGNGWKVKDVNVSTPPSGPSYTETKHEIRSTVLGGETVGERKTFSSTSGVEARFITPINGVELGAKVESAAPEGIRTYGADGAEMDTRGSDVGTENPYNSGDGGGNYPATGGDPTNYSRCAEGGVPMPCDPQSRISMNFDRIQDAINNDNDKNKTTPKPGPESAPIHEALHNSSSAAHTTATGKAEPDPEKSGAVDPASVPDDGISGRIFGPANGESFVTVSDDTPMVDASLGLNSSFTSRLLQTRTPCADMAAAYQAKRDEWVTNWESKGNKWTVEEYDKSITPLFLSKVVDGSIESNRFFVQTGGGLGPKPGQQDFKDKYIDDDFDRMSDSPDADQVHHFAAYFSAGMNGAYFSSAAHNATDGAIYRSATESWNKGTPTLKAANHGDINLARDAYQLGMNVRNNPVFLKNIGKKIRMKFCN